MADLVGMDGADRAVIERALAEPIVAAERAVWGFQNQTEIVTLGSGERLVVQRYRRRDDAEYRVRAMELLRQPAREAQIPIPRVLAADLDATPAWVVFDALPGVPVPEAGDAGLEGPRFPDIARKMGELLSSFRQLPIAKDELDDLWADPEPLVGRAARWCDAIPRLDADEREVVSDLLDRVPGQFSERRAVLAHGDFAPMNVLTDGRSLTGLLDFESVRIADPLFDVAWWHWSVSFSPPAVLEAAWPAFLHGAGIEVRDPEFAGRVRSIQVLRMLELLASRAIPSPDVEGVVADRLRLTLNA